KDLLLGRDSGQVMIHLNIGSEEDPLFDAGSYLQWGEPGNLVDIDVGVRSTPNYLDWNNDGRRDLLLGAVSGLIHVYFNEGTDTEPVFLSEYFVQEYDSPLVVPGGRSSPHFHDFDEDGRLDFISGNTNGELFLYLNIGSEESPEFGGYTVLESEGLPIDLPSAARSRPFVWDWDEDERLDVLVGAIDGKVHLFRGQEEVGVPAGELLAARLLPPWPNPFNPRLEISVELQETAEVSLRVLDVRGRLVKSLFDGNMEAGRHSLTWQADDFGSGLYTILLESAGVRQSRKAVFLK
ncbi:MAG: FG-GAP-like repeat-containing protein, partial [Candidatus Krumholzibacteria bacterium]|nr:FG-GAP-like repeat-containing protein [Candidatus Krumholzibacteria bacterium]